MKLCISNIAWDTQLDDAVGALLQQHGVSAVELAPPKYWPSSSPLDQVKVIDVRKAWHDRGQEVVAMQSLLYGTEGLSIFGDAETKEATQKYLRRIIRIAGWVGAKALVFGSPKNRDRASRSFADAVSEAAEFFAPLAKDAANAGTAIAFEPNPAHYHCNFCTTVSEALQLVDTIDHPGFGLTLDTGIASLNDEDFADVVPPARDRILHVHVSEPELAATGEGLVPHQHNANLLREYAWDGHVSIEMRGGGDELARVRESLTFVKGIYYENEL